MRVTVRTLSAEPVLLGVGDTLLFGRAPSEMLSDDLKFELSVTTLTLARCGTHVSRLLGELSVGEEAVRLRWRGKPQATLSSLFDAPGGARRGTLAEGMTAVLDTGENQLLILRGGTDLTGYVDIMLNVDVAFDDTGSSPYVAPAAFGPDWGLLPTAVPTDLEPDSDTWFVALALAEPWLAGADDYPRPPTNREISERIRTWRGDSGRLAAPQRVHDAIQQIARLAFGSGGHPFRLEDGRRVENVRYAVGRRAAEVGLVTEDQLKRVERQSWERRQRSKP
ncbi:hypothetical protein GCM10027290_51400 [Micromonospora sonneratiae]|uniref:FHA domain-containing protein n=1 Tax=Micromonospora sonneratiae TaxID=1184706 RepID=A0ABW3YCW6_9ACTN